LFSPFFPDSFLQNCIEQELFYQGLWTKRDPFPTVYYIPGDEVSNNLECLFESPRQASPFSTRRLFANPPIPSIHTLATTPPLNYPSTKNPTPFQKNTTSRPRSGGSPTHPNHHLGIRTTGDPISDLRILQSRLRQDRITEGPIDKRATLRNHQKLTKKPIKTNSILVPL
jgi:hypothetical protein